MKEYNIVITKSSVMINGKTIIPSIAIDVNAEDDMNKHTLISLADAMGYEPYGVISEICASLEV